MSGGGMKCSYGAGSLFAVAKEYNIKEPDIVIAGSGNAGTLAYFVSKQYDSIVNIWINLLATEKFINLRRITKIIDIDYLIDVVFKKQAVLDTGKIYRSKILFLIPATNVKTGHVDYFSNKNKDDIFESLRASKAIPIVYNKSIRIGEHRYCDSYISTSVKLNALKAIELGANKIIIIDNAPISILNRIIFFGWISLQNKAFKINYSKSLEMINNSNIPADVRVFYLKPQKPLKISLLDNAQSSLEKAVQQGYEETCKNMAFRRFLETK